MPATNEQQAYERLRAAILSLELAPGAPLSERGLEALAGASRTPVRAALMRLAGDGLAERLPRGWRVTPIDAEEVRAVMEFRETVERGAVALAIERASDEEIAALRAFTADHGNGDDGPTGLRDGTDFHTAVATLSRNPFFAEAVRDALTRLSRTRWLEVRTTESRAQLRGEHAAIVDAIAARDVDLARALVGRHCAGTRDRTLALLTGADARRRLRASGIEVVAG